jgi:hypothetical protein
MTPEERADAVMAAISNVMDPQRWLRQQEMVRHQFNACATAAYEDAARIAETRTDDGTVQVIELAKVLQAIATEPINWNTTDHHYYAGIAGKFQLLADAALGTVHEISMKNRALTPSPQGDEGDDAEPECRYSEGSIGFPVDGR